MPRWKWTVPVVVMTLALGACGSSGKSSAPATTHPSPSSTTSGSVPATTSSATTAPATRVLAHCATSQLAVSLTNASGTAGSVDFSLNLVNRSSSPCTLYGYPGVSLVAGDAGTQVGAGATRTSGPEAVVDLPPGHAAQSALRVVDALNFGGSCQLTEARGLRVYPPGQRAALFVARPTRACANPADGLLTVGPVQPGPSGGGTT